MGRDILYYVRSLITDPVGFPQSLTAPLLVWENARPDSPTGPVPTTSSGHAVSRPQGGETLVFELKKGNHPKNPFAMGVTIGRIESNDVAIDDASISRFHAYFQEQKGAWHFCDADSKNGTWLDGLKLASSQKSKLKDRSRIRVGNIDLVFMLPATFLAHLKQQMEA